MAFGFFNRGTGRQVDPALAGRVPPGQYLAKDFPVLHFGSVPRIAPGQWRLHLFGLVQQEVTLSFADLLALPQVEITLDIHCVTRWSLLDTRWRGVLLRDVLAQAGMLPKARFLFAHAPSGFTTNVPLSSMLGGDSLVAHTYAGQPLPAEHGGPVRLVSAPNRFYFWKSAKWLTGLELLAEDQLGFWERNGYHNDADPWKEERYASR